MTQFWHEPNPESHRPLEALNVSRETVALRRLERAVDRIRLLEVEVDSAFADLAEAYEACREEKIDASARFNHTMDAAWAAWRNQGYDERTWPK